MYLLIGNAADPCCLKVRAALKSQGLQAQILPSPFTQPLSFTWRLDHSDSVSRLIWDGERPLTDKEISGVLVRSTGWIETDGWQSEDLLYMQSETQAALLGWLWSLSCTVIGRCPASLWYRPHAPFIFWQPLLRRHGLPTLQVLVSNIAHEARDFREHTASAVYAPLTTSECYLLESEDDWKGLAAMQRCTPVCLAKPHGVTQLACVVGGQVIWNDIEPLDATKFEPALRRFAADVGLNFMEFVLAATPEGVRVVAVERQVHFGQFGEDSQRAIVAEIVKLLTADKCHGRMDPCLGKANSAYTWRGSTA